MDSSNFFLKFVELKKKSNSQYIKDFLLKILIIFSLYGSCSAAESDNQYAKGETKELIDKIRIYVHSNDERGVVLLEHLRKKAIKAESVNLLIRYLDFSVKYYRQQSNFDRALELTEEVLDTAREFQNDKYLSRIALRKIPLLIEQNKISEADGLIDKMSNAELDTESNILLLKYKADLYQARGAYDLAFKEYIEVLTLLDGNSKNQSLLASVYNNLGNTSHLLARYTKAIEYYRFSTQLYEKIGDELQRVVTIANMGGTLRALGKKREALEHYQSAYDAAKDLNVPDVVAQYLVNMGNIHTDLGNYDRALEQFNMSLEICKDHGIEYGVALNHLNMGYAYYQRKEYNSALAAYDKAMLLSEQYDFKYEKRQLFENYADLYEDKGQFDLAYVYLEKFTELNNDLLNEERIAITEEAEAKYEAQLKDARLQQQKAQIERERTKVMMLYAAIVLGFIVILSGIVLYRARITRLQEQFERLKKEKLIVSNGIQNEASILNGESKLQETKHILHQERADEKCKDNREDDFWELYSQIQKEFNDSELYTDPNLTLEDLSEAVSSNTSYVSKAIRLHADSNFNGFVNYYRIKKATDILYNEKEKISVFELMDRCGFASKSSFYRWFKKNTGMSPDQFRDLVKKDTADINYQP